MCILLYIYNKLTLNMHFIYLICKQKLYLFLILNQHLLQYFIADFFNELIESGGKSIVKYLLLNFVRYLLHTYSS